MRFLETRLPGVFIVEIEPIEDERGFFARSWSRDEFAARGLNCNLIQCNISFNRVKGTLRGLHYQVAPHQEVKLIRCTMGAIHDIIVDLRPDSPTFKQYETVVLTSMNRRSLFVPEGLAHGFQTLENDTEVFYQMSEAHVPECAKGVRWDDPAFDIQWPADDRVISSRDQQFPDFEA